MRTPKTPEPFTERQVVPGELRGEFTTHVPEGSFGGVSPGVQKGLEENVDLTSRIQDQADKFQVNAAKNAFLEQKNGFLPQALSTQGMSAAQYAPDVKDSLTQKWFPKTAQSVLSMAQNPRQQGMIQSFLAGQHVEIGKTLQTHIAKESAKATAVGMLDEVKNNLNTVPMVYNIPDARANARKGVETAVNNLMDWKGVPKEGEKASERQLQLDSQLGNFDSMVVQAYLGNQNASGAKAYIDELKNNGQLQGAKLDRLQKMVNVGATKEFAFNTWDTKYKYWTNAEGYPNTKAIEADILKDKSMTTEQRRETQNIVQAQAGKQRTELDQQKGDRWKTFEDKVADARKNNTPLQTQLNIVPLMGGSDREQERMRDYIQAPFIKRDGLTINIGGGKTSGQLTAHLNLLESIQDGRLTDSSVIGKLYDDGTLTPKQYATALKMFNTMAKGGPAREVTFARNQIRKQAFEILPAEEATKFMTDFAERTQGNTPEQMHEQAKKLLEPEAKNPSHFWDRITGNKEAEYDNGPLESDQGLMKSLVFEVGKEPVNAILSSISKEANTKPNLSDVEGFLHALGDVPLSEIGHGKPLNNTMLSVLNWNRMNPERQIPFTPKAIKALSEKHPDGYF